MRIVVPIKEVPDTYGPRKLDTETGLADRAASDAIIDEINERALEAALRWLDDDPEAEVIALSMGPESASGNLRRALAVGATSAVHIVDAALRGADLSLTAETLAAAIRRLEADLVMAGNMSTDGGGGVIPAMLAEHLDVPHITGLTSLDISHGRVGGVRRTEWGEMRVSAALPAVVSITDAFPGARMASFKGIMAAKKKPYETLSLADLGVQAEGERVHSILLSVAPRPPREAGVKLVDEGDAVEQLASFLVDRRLV